MIVFDYAESAFEVHKYRKIGDVIDIVTSLVTYLHISYSQWTPYGCFTDVNEIAR